MSKKQESMDWKKLSVEEVEKKLVEYEEISSFFGRKQPCGSTVDVVAPYVLGKNYFIRTVTHHYAGRLVWVGDKEFLLEDVSWIADDGRFTQALEKEEFDEVELYPKGKKVVIGRGAVLDAIQIGKLPGEQK